MKEKIILKNGTKYVIPTGEPPEINKQGLKKYNLIKSPALEKMKMLDPKQRSEAKTEASIGERKLK